MRKVYPAVTTKKGVKGKNHRQSCKTSSNKQGNGVVDDKGLDRFACGGVGQRGLAGSRRTMKHINSKRDKQKYEGGHHCQSEERLEFGVAPLLAEDIRDKQQGKEDQSFG